MSLSTAHTAQAKKKTEPVHDYVKWLYLVFEVLSIELTWILPESAKICAQKAHRYKTVLIYNECDTA